MGVLATVHSVVVRGGQLVGVAAILLAAVATVAIFLTDTEQPTIATSSFHRDSGVERTYAGGAGVGLGAGNACVGDDCVGDEGEHSVRYVGEHELYKDGYVTITDQAITLHCFYFPMGTAKRIPFEHITFVSTDEQEEVAWYEYKTWGMGISNIWWAWGTGRSQLFWDSKQVNLIISTGSYIRKGCSVTDINRVMGILNRFVKTCHPEMLD
eukprot:TRINITY_DN3968_c1_g1_i2.p1 TRINITY_DN3968_c1_g1~~TRINITY_DN3968_c1_g1_i2.p1  ORF type:complete len:211 (-),score=18.63 TRINITY_DN3968_c1_g1_i2:145-777(-)